jgi:proteasome lid subunit RPN8/RPN11
MSSDPTRPLQVSASIMKQIGDHAIACYPEEACGLLVGSGATNTVLEFHPTENTAKSARVYTINAREHLIIERDAEDAGHEVIGVIHSHTQRGVPEPRNYRIINEVITETPIQVS